MASLTMAWPLSRAASQGMDIPLGGITNTSPGTRSSLATPSSSGEGEREGGGDNNIAWLAAWSSYYYSVQNFILRWCLLSWPLKTWYMHRHFTYMYMYMYIMYMYRQLPVKADSAAYNQLQRQISLELTFAVPHDSDGGRWDDHVMKLLPVPPRLEQADQHGHSRDQENNTWWCIACV